MRAQLIHEQLAQAIRSHSGLEEHRPYVGMSQIGHCATEQVRKFLQPRRVSTDRAHQTALRGYLIEGEFKTLLAAAGIAKITTPFPQFDSRTGQTLLGSERELIAPFDSRFRGHTDGETVWGELLEIKSMTQEKFDEALKLTRIHPYHYAQIQIYMHYGGYERAQVVYISSQTFDHACFTVAHNEARCVQLEEKARRILAAIDAGDPTLAGCNCPRCNPNTHNFTYPVRDETVLRVDDVPIGEPSI